MCPAAGGSEPWGCAHITNMLQSQSQQHRASQGSIFIGLPDPSLCMVPAAGRPGRSPGSAAARGGEPFPAVPLPPAPWGCALAPWHSGSMAGWCWLRSAHTLCWGIPALRIPEPRLAGQHQDGHVPAETHQLLAPRASREGHGQRGFPGKRVGAQHQTCSSASPWPGLRWQQGAVSLVTVTKLRLEAQQGLRTRVLTNPNNAGQASLSCFWLRMHLPSTPGLSEMVQSRSQGVNPPLDWGPLHPCVSPSLGWGRQRGHSPAQTHCSQHEPAAPPSMDMLLPAGTHCRRWKRQHPPAAPAPLLWAI